MMKKVFLSLLLTVICLPALFAQGNAAHVIKIDSITTCHDYMWERNSVTYSEDTVVLYATDDTTFILNYTRLHSVYDTVNAIEVVGNCSATWGGYTWTESGIYYDTLPSASGCDSIVKIHVTIASFDTVRDEVVCGSYTAPWGKVYTQSATIDTVVVLGTCVYHNIVNLTVNPVYTGINLQVKSGCYYTWGDTTITDMASHTRTFKTVEGQCDSVVTLKVIEYSGEQFDTVKVVSCDSYKPAWSSAVTTSGYYSTDSTIYVGGEECTKHYTIDLTVVVSNNDTANTEPVSIAAGCAYNWDGDTLTDEDVHYRLYSSTVGGCDSLAAVQVTFSGKEYDTLHVEYCGKEYKWKDYNKNLPGNASKYTFTSDIVTKDSVTDNSGCTTVYVLDLKFVNKKDTVYRYYCGTSYKYTYKNENGTSMNTTFTEGGYHDVSAEGNIMYEVNNSTGCKTERTLNLNLHIPELRYRPDTTFAVACERYRFKADYTNGYWITFTEDADTDVVHEQRSQYYEDQCYDSIAHLTLTINYNTFIDRNPSNVCDSYTWIESGDTIGVYTTSGTYRDTLDAPNADGCLVIARLKLNVNKTPVVDIVGNWMLQPGESTVLTARPTADSDPITRYRWYVGTGATAASTDSTLELTNVTANTDVRLESTSNRNCTAKNWITVTSNVGIDEADGLQVNLFPNPASRFLNIESAEVMARVEVYNTVGQKVIDMPASGSNMVLDLSGLADGHYTLRLVGNDGNQTTRKFIVNK